MASPHNYLAILSWALPVVAVTVISVIQLAVLQHFIRPPQCIYEFIFLLNLSIEAAVAMRCQFPHEFKVVQQNCVAGLISSFAAFVVLFCDLCGSYKRKIPTAFFGTTDCIEKSYQNCVKFCYFFRVLSVSDIFQIIGSGSQLTFRALEVYVRFGLPLDGSAFLPVSVIQSDFDVLPLLLSMCSFSARLFQKFKISREAIDVMILGHWEEMAQQDAAQGNLDVGQQNINQQVLEEGGQQNVDLEGGLQIVGSEEGGLNGDQENVAQQNIAPVGLEEGGQQNVDLEGGQQIVGLEEGGQNGDQGNVLQQNIAPVGLEEGGQNGDQGNVVQQNIAHGVHEGGQNGDQGNVARQNIVHGVEEEGQNGVQGNQLQVAQQNMAQQPSALLTAFLNIDHVGSNSKTFGLWSKVFTVNGRDLTYNMWEMKRSPDNVATQWTLPAVDFVLIHFSLVDDRASFERVEGTWIPMLKERAPNTPIILIGTRHNGGNRVITLYEVQELIFRSSAIAYMEWNSDNLHSLQRIINRIAQLMM